MVLRYEGGARGQKSRKIAYVFCERSLTWFYAYKNPAIQNKFCAIKSVEQSVNRTYSWIWEICSWNIVFLLHFQKKIDTCFMIMTAVENSHVQTMHLGCFLHPDLMHIKLKFGTQVKDPEFFLRPEKSWLNKFGKHYIVTNYFFVENYQLTQMTWSNLKEKIYFN
jgi:hypothetical protein